MSSKSSSSVPPPSSAIPGKSGGSVPYIAGVVVLAALIAGLFFLRSKNEPPQPAPTPPVPTPTETAPQTLNAPPPPPKIEELDAGVGEDAGAKAQGGKGTAGGGPCSGKCGDGKSSGALESALRSTAASAQGCYNRALRSSEASGSMTVSVQVAQNGTVCSASIVNDTVHNGEISSCVLGRFRGRSFPPPQSGCVVVNIPINFTIKQ